MVQVKIDDYKYVFLIILVVLILLSTWPIFNTTSNINTNKYTETPKMVVVNPQAKYPMINLNDTYDNPGKNKTKFYNLMLTKFDSDDLNNINDAHIILDPSDLLDRKPLHYMPNHTKKSLLTLDDIKNVAENVHYLRSRNNNVGAYMSVGSLESTREDVYLQHLEAGKDYSLEYKRTLLSGDEYLPIGDLHGAPTRVYEDFMRYRMSQIKRAGFDFVYFGQFDPYSIFNYDSERVVSNPTIDIDEYRPFIMRLFQYANELRLKVCISDFSRIFKGYEKRLVDNVHYINVFAIDSRTFIQPSSKFVKECKKLPVFLSTLYNNDVIKNFVNIAKWPLNSILYEMTPINNPFPVNLGDIVINKQDIDWYPLPPKVWKDGDISQPPLPIVINKISEPVLEIRNVYQPIYMPEKPIVFNS